MNGPGYITDVLKNVGIGIIVASLLGLFLNPQNVPIWKLIYTLFFGILLTVDGYVILKEGRRKKNRGGRK